MCPVQKGMATLRQGTYSSGPSVIMKLMTHLFDIPLHLQPVQGYAKGDLTQKGMATLRQGTDYMLASNLAPSFGSSFSYVAQVWHAACRLSADHNQTIAGPAAAVSMRLV